MLLDIWSNASNTATFYVSGIALFYLVGLFCLLIHSIRQRTDQVTYYDVYMELCDVIHYLVSIFQTRDVNEPNEQPSDVNNGQQSLNSFQLTSFENSAGKLEMLLIT